MSRHRLSVIFRVSFRKVLRILKFFTRTRRRKILSSILAFVMLLTSLQYLFFGPKNTKAAWFDDSFAYREKITINNSLTTQSNYAYGFTLGTLDTSHLRSDCGDIRVTDVNSVPITDPYFVDCTVQTSPQIWVKFTSLPAGNTVLYIYYGSPNATSRASAMSAVFSNYSYDFAGTITDTTKVTAGGGVSTQNEIYTLQNNADAWDTYAYATTNQTRAADLTFQAKFKANSGVDAMMGWHDNGAGTSYTDLVYGLYLTNGTFDAYEDGNNRAGSGSYTNGTWYDLKVVLKAAGATYYYKAVSANTWTSIYDSTYSSETPLKPGVVHYQSGALSYTDNWIVRQQLSTEPTVTIASEEKGNSPIAYWKFDEGTNKSDSSLPITKNEEQINILNQPYTTTSGSAAPTDNSLGIVHWDASKYPNSCILKVYLPTMGS